MLELRGVAPLPRPLTKDPLLVLRDRYWALTLQRLAGGKSFAALERELCPHLHIRLRDDGEGRVQPFSLSKVAAGTRGLSPSASGWPEKVEQAERRYRGSSSAFKSLLWKVLACAREGRGLENPGPYVSDEVARRFSERHQSLIDGCNMLNASGLRRAGRLTHIDALGLLLWICSSMSGVRHLEPLAATYVQSMVERLTLADPAFAVLRGEIVQQIAGRLPEAIPFGQPFSSRTFQSRRGQLDTVPFIEIC